MKKERFLIMLLCCCWMLHVGAQQMWVEDFSRQKRYIWNRSSVKVEKKLALQDFITKEKGFTFTADGQQPAAFEEGDGVITVKLPAKTRFVTIQHPDYGQKMWRVPVKYLKRKKHYQATLQTINGEKDYQLQKQWVVMNISPDNAVLKLDTTVQRVRQQTSSFYLPLGMHTYQVEAPFYEAVKDSFLLTDDEKVQLNINLQPVYSYLTVKTPWKKAEIFVDGQHVAKQEGTSQKLMAGRHRVTVFKGKECCVDTAIVLSPSEKKVITFNAPSVAVPVPSAEVQPVPVPSSPASSPASVTAAPLSALVTLSTTDSIAEILVDRVKVGKGSWSGQLAQGYHQAATRKDGIESVPTDLWIRDSFPQEVQLAAPLTGCGMLNITSNVQGAKVFIDSVCVGETPLITACLPTRRNYVVRLEKPGYREAQLTSQPKSNDLLDVYIKLKRKKK